MFNKTQHKLDSSSLHYVEFLCLANKLWFRFGTEDGHSKQRLAERELDTSSKHLRSPEQGHVYKT